MTFACARALRVCAMLALPVSAFAQAPRSPTIFSPSTQLGTVNLRAAVVLSDYTVKPLPLLSVVARRTDRPDSVVAETDLDGRVSMSLRVGMYTLRARTAQPVGGRSYAWNVRVIVRAQRNESVQLTNSNASMADSVVRAPVVAAAPPPAAPAAVTHSAPVTEKVPAPAQPAQQRPTQPVTNTPVTNTKVVASVDSAKPVAPPPTRVSQPAPSPVNVAAAAAQPSPIVAPPKRVEKKAPRTNTSGLLLGLSFDASSIRSDDLTSSTESGPGAAAVLGWGVTKNFALILDASGARISSLDGDYNLAHVDAGGRWHFVNRSAFVPFVEVGYAARAAMMKDALLSDGAGNMYTGDLTIFGTGASFGGGFEYFATRSWALGGSFKWTTGQFDRVQVDNATVTGLQMDATSARFNMGFTWYPMGR